MDLRQLRFMVAVADSGALRRAARELGLAEPPISEALRALEAELGVELMLRSPSGVELTAEGEELVRRARLILRDVDEAKAAVGSTAAHGQPLRVGLVAG